MAFKDHFSSHAQSYAAARPDYPEDLILAVSDLCDQHELAWDCATGNGQAAHSLARYFKRVVATDASAEQLAQAPAADNIDYRCCSAESPQLETASADLIIVAQALHWFDSQKFFASADGVLKNKGILSVWSYGLTEIDPSLDRIVMRLYDEILGPYWPPERTLVERAYRDIEFPYTRTTLPAFKMSLHWTCEQLLAYLMSWSALQRYIAASNENPLELISEELVRAWGSESTREISWPLTVIACRK